MGVRRDLQGLRETEDQQDHKALRQLFQCTAILETQELLGP